MSPNTSDTLKPTVKILIAEDHELARYGLTLTLEDYDSVQILAEAENGEDAITLAGKHQPDVILMDIGMPKMDGITATRKIKAQYPDMKVIMLTSHQNEEEVFAALAAGADAYCMKDIKVDRLYQVILMVLDGAVWLDPAIASIVMQALPEKSQELPKNSSQRKSYNTELTMREQEVLELLVAGKSNKEIAAHLNVSSHTAKAHVCNIIQKLAVDDRTQAAVKALQEGLVNT